MSCSNNDSGSSSSSSSDEKDKNKDIDNESIIHIDVNDYIKQNDDLDFLLNNAPPDYFDVCPPTYKESFYYPNITLKIRPSFNDQDQIKHSDKIKINLPKQTKKKKDFRLHEVAEKEDKLDLTKDNDRTIQRLHVILKDKEEFFEETEKFVAEVYDFYSHFSNLNSMIEQVKNKLVKDPKAKIANRILQEQIKNKDKKTEKSKSKEKEKGKEKEKEKGKIIEMAEIIHENSLEGLDDYLNNLFLNKLNEFHLEKFSIPELTYFKKEIYVDTLNLKDFMCKFANFKNK